MRSEAVFQGVWGSPLLSALPEAHRQGGGCAACASLGTSGFISMTVLLNCYVESS